ncbi:hypothetical protein HYZ80_02015 [Candidatus Parcubacteria bacterium]|nr:hypothetical protein [Candidatus Parcubacteria bacterium]
MQRATIEEGTMAVELVTECREALRRVYRLVSVLRSALICAYTLGRFIEEGSSRNNEGGPAMAVRTECQRVRSEIFHLRGGGRMLQGAILHIVGCRRGICAGIWNGWAQLLASAARLRAACGRAAAPSVPHGSQHDCAWAQRTLREPTADELVRAATVHIVSCADADGAQCLAMKQALVQYLSALRALNNPGQLELPEEVREALARGKYLAPPHWPMVEPFAILSDLRRGSG